MTLSGKLAFEEAIVVVMMIGGGGGGGKGEEEAGGGGGEEEECSYFPIESLKQIFKHECKQRASKFQSLVAIIVTIINYFCIALGLDDSAHHQSCIRCFYFKVEILHLQKTQ